MELTQQPAAEDLQVAVINKSLEVFKTAPGILNTNRDRTQKAMVIGSRIINDWEAAWAIEDQETMLVALASVDERSNKFLVNCSTALKQEMELRAPITQLMDSFKSMFTEAEKELDRTKDGGVPKKVQNNRNAYAKKLDEIKEAKRKAAQLIEDKGKEIVELTAEAEKRLFSKYNEYLLNVKKKLQGAFDGLTLANWDEIVPSIKGYVPALKKDAVEKFEFNLYGRYHTQEEVTEMISKLIADKIPEFSANYMAELSLLRDELIDKLASKNAELLEEKKLADEAEQLRLKQQQEQNEAKKEALKKQQEKLAEEQKKLEDDKKIREEKAQQQITAEAAEAESKNTEKVEIKAQGESTMLMFNKEAVIADTTTGPEIRKSWKITVLHQVGYTQIFTLWFEKIGKDLPVDKLGATKLDSMKTWCEKEAKDKGTFIEGKFLRYDEDFTTIARKEKAEKV